MREKEDHTTSRHKRSQDREIHLIRRQPNANNEALIPAYMRCHRERVLDSRDNNYYVRALTARDFAHSCCNVLTFIVYKYIPPLLRSDSSPFSFY
jgi:hypothetical protein